MLSYSKDVVAEIDLFIAEQMYSVCLWKCRGMMVALNPCTKPMKEKVYFSLVFLLKRKPDLGNASHLNLYTIDGGVFIDRSNETEEFEELLFESEEGWTIF